jgi:hypothetical protein
MGRNLLFHELGSIYIYIYIYTILKVSVSTVVMRYVFTKKKSLKFLLTQPAVHRQHQPPTLPSTTRDSTHPPRAPRGSLDARLRHTVRVRHHPELVGRVLLLALQSRAPPSPWIHPPHMLSSLAHRSHAGRGLRACRP